MNIVCAETLTPAQKQAVHDLWNTEYPVQLHLEGLPGLEIYLSNLKEQQHFLLLDDAQRVCGWAFTFVRENETWFAMILSRTEQRKGHGSRLLSALKESAPVLNGWVIDHHRDMRADGNPYLSPLRFYVQNGFHICAGIRLELDTISAVKITFRR
jgi:GNAT superfamily N-acetyltransferase